MQEQTVTFSSAGLRPEPSVELFRRAGQPAKLHLFGDADHFMFAETSTRVWSVLRDCLERYFPARRDQPGA